MQKWKIVVILLLLGGLVGYKAMEQNPARERTPAASPVAPQAGAPQAVTPEAGASSFIPPGQLMEPPAPAPPIMKMQNKPAIAWNIPARLWINAPQPPKLSALKGKVVLLEFFRTECSHCQEAAPFMKYLHQTYGPRGLQVVAIQAPGTAPVENDWQAVKNWATQRELPYPIAFDEGSRFFKQYTGVNYPSILLIDKKGVIRYIVTGHSAEKERILEEKIKAALSS